MADPRADGGICHPVSLDELFPPSHGCSSHTWLLEDFPGYNFNRFRLGVILGCNKMWQTYVLLVLFFFFLSLETPVALFGLKKQICSSHAESRQRNLINVCELWAVFHDGLINLRKKKTKKLFSVTQADVWNQMSDSFISDLIKNWSRFSDKELDAPFVHSSNVCSSFLHPCKLDSQSALKQNKKKKNVPTFLGSHPWHFWSVDKISLLFIVNKAAPESVFLTAARVLTSHRFSFWDGSIHLCSQFWTVQRWRNTIFGVEIQVNLGCCVSYKGKRDKSAGRTDTSDLKCTL